MLGDTVGLLWLKPILKWHFVVFGAAVQTQNFNNHDANEVITQTQEDLFFSITE